MEEYRRRFLRIAVGIYLFNLGAIVLIASLLPSEQVSWPLASFVIGTWFLTTAILWSVPWHRLRPDWLLTVFIVTVIQIHVLVAATGGEGSPFFLLHFFAIILSGAYFTGWPLAAVTILVAVGPIVDHIIVPAPRPFNWGEHLLSLSVYIAAMTITHLLFTTVQRTSLKAWQLAEHFGALLGASRLLHAEATSHFLFDKLLEIGRQETGARYAALRTFDDAGNLADFYHTGLAEEERALLSNPPRDVGILGEVRAGSGPVRLVDLTTHPLHRGFPPGHPPMKSLLGVPITWKGRLIGKLYLCEKRNGQPFTAEDEMLIIILAEHAAVAIEKTRILEKSQAQATTDALTGLYNYRAFHERLHEEIKRALRHGRVCSLLLADLDDFKQINDTRGHPTGDAVLKAVAEALKRHRRSTDFLARYGGEEFIVLLPETDKQAALGVAEQIRSAISHLVLQTSQGQEVAVSVSIGVASYPDDADTPKALLDLADTALYRAKRSGKNQVAS